MIITATELKKNLGKYLELAMKEDVLITKNGNIIVQISAHRTDKIDLWNSLDGILDNESDIDVEQISIEKNKLDENIN